MKITTSRTRVAKNGEKITTTTAPRSYRYSAAEISGEWSSMA
jgi:hypothetical protein